MERLKENAYNMYNILYIYIPMWTYFCYHTRKEQICQQIRDFIFSIIFISFIIYYIGLTRIGNCSIMKAR